MLAKALMMTPQWMFVVKTGLNEDLHPWSLRGSQYLMYTHRQSLHTVKIYPAAWMTSQNSPMSLAIHSSSTALQMRTHLLMQICWNLHKSDACHHFNQLLCAWANEHYTHKLPRYAHSMFAHKEWSCLWSCFNKAGILISFLLLLNSRTNIMYNVNLFRWLQDIHCTIMIIVCGTKVIT